MTVANADVGVDHERLSILGGKISGLAENTRSKIESIKKHVDELSNYWGGKEYNDACLKLYDEMNKIERLLDRYEGTGTWGKDTASKYAETEEGNTSRITGVTNNM